MTPLIALGAAAGAYFLYTKVFKTNLSSGTRPGTPTVDVHDASSGITFQAQVVSSFKDGTKMVDVFTSSGSRIVRFMQTGSDKSSRVEIMSPAGVDPAIKAAAMRVYGIRPKG